MQKFLFLIGAVLAVLRVILIYDARPITRRIFGFGYQNEASMGLKIFGFLISIGGAILVYFNI